MEELDLLLKADRNFSKLSVNMGAAAAFKAYLVNEATLLPNKGQPLLGIDRIYQSMAGNYTLRWSPETGKVADSNDMGYTWGNYSNEYLDSQGKRVVEKGKYLNIWVKQDGQWKVAVDMGNLS